MVQPQHGTSTKRVKCALPVLTVQWYTHGESTKTGKRYIIRAGHARPLYKRYKHGTHYAMVQPQHGTSTKRVKRTLLVLTVQWYTHGTSTKASKRYIIRAGHARPLYKRYKHGTHCAMVQPQHGTSTKRVKRTLLVLTVQWYTHGTIPALVTLDHCTRGTSTVHTVQWYNHGTSTNTGSPSHCTRGTMQYTLCDGTSTVRAQARVRRYITRAGMYKEYKHGTSMSKISTSPVLATPNNGARTD